LGILCFIKVWVVKEYLTTAKECEINT
jgi:hypothetical protein